VGGAEQMAIRKKGSDFKNLETCRRKILKKRLKKEEVLIRLAESIQLSEVQWEIRSIRRGLRTINCGPARLWEGRKSSRLQLVNEAKPNIKL